MDYVRTNIIGHRNNESNSCCLTSRVVDVPPDIRDGGVPVVVGEEQALVAVVGVGGVAVGVLVAPVPEGGARHEPVRPVAEIPPP